MSVRLDVSPTAYGVGMRQAGMHEEATSYACDSLCMYGPIMSWCVSVLALLTCSSCSCMAGPAGSRSMARRTLQASYVTCKAEAGENWQVRDVPGEGDAVT